MLGRFEKEVEIEEKAFTKDDTRAGVERAASKGILVPGKPDKSELIEQGAKWQDHWAFVAPTRPKPPSGGPLDKLDNSVDRSISRKLQQAGRQRPALE